VILSRFVSLPILFAVAAFLGVSRGLAQDASEGETSSAILNSWLRTVMETIPTNIKPQKIVRIDDEDLQRVFSGDSFFGIYFATWPVAPRLPKELSYETVVRVRQGGSVESLRNAEALRVFLAETLVGVDREDRAREAVRASLRLAEAGSKAGSLPFEKPDVSVVRQPPYIIATARAKANGSDLGYVMITMRFSDDGRVTTDAISIEDQTRRGPPSKG
jgi:hypothetical protein